MKMGKEIPPRNSAIMGGVLPGAPIQISSWGIGSRQKQSFAVMVASKCPDTRLAYVTLEMHVFGAVNPCTAR